MGEEWLAAAEQAGVRQDLMAILTDIAANGLYPCARGGSGEVGMGAAWDAYAAFYVSHRGLTLALDPIDAKALAGRLRLTLIPKNATTHYVKCPSDRLLEETFALRVSEAAERAWGRSWEGPRWSREGETSADVRVASSCPIHNCELSVSGFCLGCDDQPLPCNATATSRYLVGFSRDDVGSVRSRGPSRRARQSRRARVSR